MNKVEKCSETQKNRIVIHKGNVEKRIYQEELLDYLSDGWSKGVSDKHRNRCSDARMGISSWNKGIPCDESTKKKISDSLKGNVPWNRGLTSETDDRVKMGGIKQRGKVGSNRGKKFTKEHKQHLSESMRGKPHKFTEEGLRIKLSKDYITRKANNSFNTSNPEDVLYKTLQEENKTKTIYRNYKCERYPFYCDFYIVEDDLFIELNAHWTHGGKPYDPNDIECQEQLKIWEEKAKTSQFYKNAIETWTVRDVKKLQCADKNHLNYKVIY